MPHWSTMFREADGSVSSARVCMILATAIVFGVWGGLSISTVCHGGKLLDLPMGVVFALGIPYGLKWGQQKGESVAPPPGP